MLTRLKTNTSLSLVGLTIMIAVAANVFSGGSRVDAKGPLASSERRLTAVEHDATLAGVGTIPLLLEAAIMLTVTSSSDAVNGDVSSATSLNARPGPDGISLREAILATNATEGAETIYIAFAPTMAGQTISLGPHLPGVRRDHVTIIGLLSAEGQPSVTIDARQASNSPRVDYMLFVQASHVTIRQLRFTGVAWEGTGFAIGIAPGNAVPQYPPGPQRISDVRVEDNLFDNRGFDFPRGGPRAGGINIHTTGFPPNKQVARVTIARNVFLNYSGNAPGVSLSGDASSVMEVTVRENRFERIDCCAIEFSAPGGAQQGARMPRS